MTASLEKSLFDELEQLVLIDPHTHINPLSAASSTLADIMGYHYYTELAHSAGLDKGQIEEDGLDPKTKVGRLVEKLSDLNNTIQVNWLIDMCREFFGFEGDQINSDNWEALYDTAQAKMSEEGWEKQVLEQSKLEKVFLTNDFDDPLEGFDTNLYVPCLRTDDLVFHFLKKSVRNRLNEASGIEVGDAATFRDAIGKLFAKFTEKNAKACAISLPPSFSPVKVDAGSAAAVIKRTVRGQRLTSAEQDMLSSYVFWTLAEHCAEHSLPFDLMIGVNRRVYETGVFQGQDLYDKRVSLIQYKQLFNAFPNVKFPISVLGSTSNQELVSYAWIFPNVITNGHWWYSNIPTYIEVDTRSRLEAVPRNKQVGYYSDMYKLEFALPKFRMYRKVLAKVLASDFVAGRGWSEQQALDFGKQVLRGNVETIFNIS